MRLTCSVFLICFALFAASCTGSNEKTTESSAAKATETPKADAGPVQSKLTEAGTQELMGLVSKYYALKNALVATKEADVTAAAMQLSAAAEGMQAMIQKDSTNKTALQPFTDTVVMQSKLVINMKDPSCEQQRLAFGTISRAMYGLLKNADVKNAKVYHEYCPMAFNDKGATWLSDDAEIKNPYFGKKMLECGEVTDSL